MTLLTDIYGVVNKERGIAKEGWVRPTVGEFFTTRDYYQESTIFRNVPQEPSVVGTEFNSDTYALDKILSFKFLLYQVAKIME